MPLPRPKAIGVLLAAMILLAGGLLFVVARSRYEEQLRQKIWHPSLPGTSLLISNPLRGAKSTVLLIGDSRMAAWRLMDLGPRRLINAAAGGLTTGEVRLQVPALLDQYHPDAVVLEAGINDLKFLGLRPEMSGTIVLQAESNLVQIVDLCAARGCKIIVLETWPAGRPSLARRLVWSDAVNVGVEQLNARLRLLKKSDGSVRTVDLFQRAGIEIAPQQYLDTLHFKPEVYQRLTPALKTVLDGNK